MNWIRVIFIVLLFLDVYWWWVSDRKLREMKRGSIWRAALAAWIVLQGGLMIVRFLPPGLSRAVFDWVPLWAVVGQYLWHLGVLPIVVIAPLVGRAGKALGRVISRGGAPAAASAITRRQMMGRVAAVAVPPMIVGAGSIGAIAQFGEFRVRRITVRVKGLAPALEGMTIAHLSDFHAGRFMTPPMMRRVVDTTNEMQPDLVVITGDLIDYALRDLPAAIDEVLRLRPANGFRSGVAMCIGNHDLIDSGPEFARQVRAAGIPFLTNSVKTLDLGGRLIQLGAIHWYQKESMTEAAVQFVAKGIDRGAGAGQGGLPILLAHHPHAFDEAARQGIPLTLSGHTHGGQIMATKDFGAGSMMFRYVSGLYAKDNGSQLVVSNGIGNWFPLRINAPAEILRLTLVAAG